MHEGMDAVIAGISRHAEVRHDEPLRRERALVVIGGLALGARDHRIDAGRKFAERLIDRERGRHIGIERLLDGKLTAPNLDAVFGAEPLDVVTIERALEIAAEHRVEQIAIADAIHLDSHGGRVHAHHRNALLAVARQHISLVGEAHERFAVAHIDREIGGLGERLLHGRRQARTQRDRITLTVFEPLDANLFAVGGNGRLVLARDIHEGREVGAFARQAFRELEARTWRGGIEIHLVIDQAEPVIVAQSFVLDADVGRLARFKRKTKRIQRRPPDFAIRRMTGR